MKILSRIRFLPITIFFAAMMLSIKVSHIWDGIEEFKLLSKRRKSCKLDKYLIDIGIDDVSLFESKAKYVNFVKFPIWYGIEEFKLFS